MNSGSSQKLALRQPDARRPHRGMGRSQVPNERPITFSDRRNARHPRPAAASKACRVLRVVGNSRGAGDALDARPTRARAASHAGLREREGHDSVTFRFFALTHLGARSEPAKRNRFRTCSPHEPLGTPEHFATPMNLLGGPRRSAPISTLDSELPTRRVRWADAAADSRWSPTIEATRSGFFLFYLVARGSLRAIPPDPERAPSPSSDAHPSVYPRTGNRDSPSGRARLWARPSNRRPGGTARVLAEKPPADRAGAPSVLNESPVIFFRRAPRLLPAAGDRPSRHLGPSTGARAVTRRLPRWSQEYLRCGFSLRSSGPMQRSSAGSAGMTVWTAFR